ncbi:MAG: hypothetical protein KF685_07840 [Acidobacteria bacterium]|nr:hypothetical protein [Acidobacteriota bacterium]
MGRDIKLNKNPKATIFNTYGDKITEAYNRAVREALIRHRKLGNYVVVERDGKIVKLQGEEIDELLA